MHLCSLTCKLKTWQTVPVSLCCTCLSPQDGALVLLMLTHSLWEDNLLQEDLKEGVCIKDCCFICVPKYIYRGKAKPGNFTLQSAVMQHPNIDIF